MEDYAVSLYLSLGMVAGILEFLKKYYIALIIVGIVILVLWCIIFKRAGVFPLFAIVPVLNIFLMHEIAQRRRAFIASIILSIAAAIFSNNLRGLVLLCVIGDFLCMLSMASGLTDVFKHKSVIILPLVIVLFPVIGYAIIAFGKNGRYEPLQSPFAK